MLVLSYKNIRYYELHKPSLLSCQLYAYIYLLYALSNRQPIKKRIMFLPGYGPMAIADWSIIVQCHLLGFPGAVVEMGAHIYWLVIFVLAGIPRSHCSVMLFLAVVFLPLHIDTNHNYDGVMYAQ
jgi:hypothetical protein